MGSIQSHQDLIVWQKVMDLAAEGYRLSKLFPKAEEYRLTSQILRAATSVPANIAEGHARGARKDDAHFITMARGSLAETETLVQLAIKVEVLGQIKPTWPSIYAAKSAECSTASSPNYEQSPQPDAPCPLKPSAYSLRPGP